MDLFKRACEIKDEITAHRRYLHKNAEVGMTLPRTVGYIKEVLNEYGVKAEPYGGGLVASIGEGERTVLLRADMDALPMKELSGENFASCVDCTAHACGHDLHAAMLLGAVKLLSENRDRLKGTVKLMFQPGEEQLTGCLDMIAAGVLDAPAPSAAFAVHTGAGKLPPGVFMYNAGGVMMFSADSFRIEITGSGGHGAYPHLAADPLRTACHIYDFLGSLMAKENDPLRRASLTVGSLHGGVMGNVIPDTAVLEGYLRTDGDENRERLKRRIADGAKRITEMMGGQMKLTYSASVPPLICDRYLTERSCEYMKELNIPWRESVGELTATASDDFALIAERIPSVYIYLSAGFEDERGEHLAHDPKVRFNEDVCPIGSAVYAQLAVRYLEDISHVEKSEENKKVH